MSDHLISPRSTRLRPMRWMLALGSVVASFSCSAADDGAWEEESVAKDQQALVIIEGLTVTFACNPPTGTGIVTRRCHIDYGDGQGQVNIPPGLFTHTYPAYGFYTYTLQEQWCTAPDCSFSFGSGSRTADVDLQLVDGGPIILPSGTINLPGSYEAIAGKGISMKATGGPFTGRCVNWTFGDGDKDTCDNESVTHVYDDPGTYWVRADLFSNGTKLDSDTAQVRIYACLAHATCTVRSGVVSYDCVSGYRDNGTKCVDIDECADNTDNCSSSRRCDNTSGSFQCIPCAEGYRANSAGTACVDTDECLRNTDNCASTARCENTPGSFRCFACPAGYKPDSTGTICNVDIDECALPNPPCHPDGTCTNTIGSHICTCPAALPYGSQANCFATFAEYDAFRNATCRGAQQSCYNSCLPWGGSSCDTSCGPVFAQCMAYFP